MEQLEMDFMKQCNEQMDTLHVSKEGLLFPFIYQTAHEALLH